MKQIFACTKKFHRSFLSYKNIDHSDILSFLPKKWGTVAKESEKVKIHGECFGLEVENLDNFGYQN